MEEGWQRTNKPKSNSTRLSVKCWKKIILDSRLHNNTFIHSKIIHHCERFTFSVTLLPLPVDSVSDLHVGSHSWVCNVYLDCRLINIAPGGTRLVAVQLQSISWTSYQPKWGIAQPETKWKAITFCLVGETFFMKIHSKWTVTSTNLKGWNII